MNCVYIIIEKFTSPAGNVEQTTVCAALNEEEAKHKVKYLNENAIIPFRFQRLYCKIRIYCDFS